MTTKYEVQVEREQVWEPVQRDGQPLRFDAMTIAELARLELIGGHTRVQPVAEGER